MEKDTEIACLKAYIRGEGNTLIDELDGKIDILTVELKQERKARKIAELKANQLHDFCPDHRDKQRGKSCLACQVESFEALAMRLIVTLNLVRSYMSYPEGEEPTGLRLITATKLMQSALADSQARDLVARKISQGSL